MPEQFHFLEPLWLMALLPLAVLLWRIGRHSGNASPWRKIVDARLLPLLMHERPAGGNRLPLLLLALGWMLAVLALADPTWEQRPQPLMQTAESRMIVLDLSRSMLAADLQPSRLERARFKVEDILANDVEGRTGLVVFAGDAFGVTPLTRDTNTLRAHLKALDPALMPAQGSRADLGLLKAEELLLQAGVKTAQVILIADGVEGEQSMRAAARLRNSGYRVSVLGVGTAQGAPLPELRGGVSKDASGKPRIVKLDAAALQDVARAGGGRYSPLTGNSTDIDYLLEPAGAHSGSMQTRDTALQQWKEQGPLLAVLLLPLAALAFRRGWLLCIVMCSTLVLPPREAAAFGWNDLWLRPAQQAAQAFEQQRFEAAQRLADDPLLRGSAAYRRGEYAQAAEDFAQAPGSVAAYNRGNALAQSGAYPEAIAAYEEALKQQPGMQDALANKAAVEALLEAQPPQESPQDSGNAEDSQAQDEAGEGGEPGQQGESSQQAGQSQGDPDAQSPETGNPSENNASNDTPGQPAQPGERAADAQAAEDAQQPQAGEPDDAGEADNAFARANRELEERGQGQQDEATAEASTQAQAQQGRAPVEPGPDPDRQAEAGAPVAAEALDSEEQLAAQQWLRRIEDDPGGLLRRKFLYQYRQREAERGNTHAQDW